MARTSSFEEVEQLFISNVGNAPNDMFQFLNFCKQQNIPFQYKQIKTWWKHHKVNHNIPQIPETLRHRTAIQRTKSKSSSKAIKLLSNPSKFMLILKTEIQNYRQLLSNYNHLTHNECNPRFIRKRMLHYASFLTTLMTLKDATYLNADTIHQYLNKDHNALHPDIQLLWRIHLLHPVLYKQHYERLFGFVFYPKYSYINPAQRTNINENSRVFKRKSKSVVMKQMFESIAFESKIKSYLLFMHKILHMFDHTDINKEIVNEYSEYIEFLAQSKYLNVNIPTIRAQEVIDVRIKNLSYFLPTLKQSFLWFTHALFPGTFHHELSRKLTKYKEYSFVDLDHVSLHDEYTSNKLWLMMKEDKMQNFEMDNAVQSLIQARNNEYLVCGFVETQSLSGKYLVPIEIIHLLVTFCNMETQKIRTTNYSFEDDSVESDANDRYHKDRLRYYEERRHLNLYSFTGRYVVYGGMMVPQYNNCNRYYHRNRDFTATPLYG